VAVNLIFKCRTHSASKRVREARELAIAGQVHEALKSVAASTTTDAHMFGARYIKLMGSTVSQLYIYIARRPNSNPCPRVSITLFKMSAANEPGDRATCFYSYAIPARMHHQQVIIIISIARALDKNGTQLSAVPLATEVWTIIFGNFLWESASRNP